METILKADIFFFIASVATVALSVMASIVLFYLIKAGKHLCALSEALQDGFEHSEKFVAELKERLEDNPVFRLFFPLLRRRRRVAAKNNSH
ncbi:MAG: hypothetical protein Q8R17_02850 [bacterium]|nr:hypothetical protein [bacterium]